MRESFAKCVKYLMSPAIEGGYVNNPNDTGRETKYGISKRWYPKLDIKNLTLEQAAAIYLKDYWIPAGCDKLPWPLDWVVFDTAVNMGGDDAKKLLKLTKDWTKYLILRLLTYNKIVLANPKQAPNLKSWKNRISKVKKFAEELDK